MGIALPLEKMTTEDKTRVMETILIETPFGDLSRAIQRLNGDYALYFSKRHKKPGHLFQGRFKAMLVEKEIYLLELSRYIHLNPVRVGMVKSPERYKWSSCFASDGNDKLSYNKYRLKIMKNSWKIFMI